VTGITGYNSYFPMLFSEAMRIEIVNEGRPLVLSFWYHVDYEEWEECEASFGRSRLLRTKTTCVRVR